MRIAYLDCFSGISGDMFLGALLDAGLEQDLLEKVRSHLGLSDVRLEVTRESRCGLQGTRLQVHFPSKSPQRKLNDILRLLEKTSFAASVRENAKKIFQTLAEVEAKIHGTPVEDVHFHELGAVDSLIDIVGACSALEALKIDAVYASALPLTSGFTQSDHGKIPLPAPATLELLKGVPIRSDAREVELVTPTGASLLKHFSQGYGQIPEMTLEKVGYGVGTRDTAPVPNLLRVLVGETVLAQGEDEVDTVSLLETNIDDMNPQFLAHVFDRLLEAGALDVYLTPIQMKDSRSGMKLSVITEPQDQARLAGLIFDQTTTLGIRIFRTDRLKLRRQMVQVKTDYGVIPVKVGYKDGKISTLSPEYKAIKELADRTGEPLKEIYFKTLAEAQRKFLGWK